MKHLVNLFLVLSLIKGTVFGQNLMITEIMQNPSKVNDSDGEWFEVYNPTSAPIDMIGWRIYDAGTNSHVIENSLIVPVNGFIVLGRNNNFSTNGGVNLDYEYAGFTLGNSDDEIIIIDDNDNEIDRVEYTGSAPWPNPTGASMIFTGIPNENNNLGSNWILSESETYGDGDYGSPGYNGTDQSLPVTISSFTATPNNGSVLIQWTTECEVNNLGFNLYKSEIKNGAFKKLNGKIIEGAGNSTTKNEYTFKDTEVFSGKTYYYQLEDIAFDGKTKKHTIIAVIMEKTEDVLASRFQLMPAYPNPFNPETTIKYQVPEKSMVSINIYDLRGQRIKTLFSENKNAGTYNVRWDGTDQNNNPVSNGIYFYQMATSTGYSQTHKMMFLK